MTGETPRGIPTERKASAPAGRGKPVTRMALVCAISTAVAIGLYAGYKHFFPFRGAPSVQGVCLACGAPTRLGPMGWADFCPRHHPLTPLPPLMVIAEAMSLFCAAISGWLILRRFARWGGRRTSLGLVLLSVAAMALYVLAAREPLHMAHHFVLALFLFVYTLSAAYVDSVESLILVTSIAVGVAASLTFVIMLMDWLITGYWEIA